MVTDPGEMPLGLCSSLRSVSGPACNWVGGSRCGVPVTLEGDLDCVLVSWLQPGLPPGLLQAQFERVNHWMEVHSPLPTPLCLFISLPFKSNRNKIHRHNPTATAAPRVLVSQPPVAQARGQPEVVPCTVAWGWGHNPGPRKRAWWRRLLKLTSWLGCLGLGALPRNWGLFLHGDSPTPEGRGGGEEDQGGRTGTAPAGVCACWDGGRKTDIWPGPAVRPLG